MEKWELDRIDRIEGRVDRLEQKNWERSMFWFNFAIYGMVTAFLVFTAVTIAIEASAS
jgi:hypothetical protein